MQTPLLNEVIFNHRNTTINENSDTNPVRETRQLTNKSMSGTSSSSDCESEVGYASYDKDDSRASADSDRESKRAYKPRKKLQRKTRLDQLRRLEVYSNDSDTTVDESAANCRRVKATKKSVGKCEERRECAKKKSEDTLAKREERQKDGRRIRNGSKTSWTDSGVSMSKTDSQPSTLGERTQTAKMMSKKFGCNEGCDGKHFDRSLVCNECTDSSVELVRGEIGRRSRSASEFLKNPSETRKRRSESVPAERLYASEVIVDKGEEATKAVDDGRKPQKHDSKECTAKRKLSYRYPEIIKKDSESPSRNAAVFVEGRSEERTKVSESGESSEAKSDFKIDDLSEKENEILKQLVENAKKVGEDRKISTQSFCSQDTSESINDENFFKSPRKSKLQKIKDIFKGKKQRPLRSDTPPQLSSINSSVGNNRHCLSPNLDNYFSDESSSQSKCNDFLCYCEFDENQRTKVKGHDPLSHLGRDVPTKKRSFFSRLFRTSSKHNDTVFSSPGRFYRSRSQTEADFQFGKKRSGSTRSLPESLRHLWLRAQSKSSENMSNHRGNQSNQQSEGIYAPPGFVVTRSRSNCSLYKYQFVPAHLPVDMSKSCEAIPHNYPNIRSPLTPVRRSESLRSLNIGRNYDIATHVLQAKSPDVETIENNNLFCHPYFEGNAARGDSVKKADQGLTQASNVCPCCVTSPVISPKHMYRNDVDCSCSNQSNRLLNNGMTDRSIKDSPLSISSKDTSCSCPENCFDSNYFFADEQFKNASTKYADYRGSPRHTQEPEAEIVAPLQVTVMQEKHAEKVKLKTNKIFDTFV